MSKSLKDCFEEGGLHFVGYISSNEFEYIDPRRKLVNEYKNTDKFSKENLSKFIGKSMRDIVAELAPDLILDNDFCDVYGCPFDLFGSEYICPITDSESVKTSCKECWHREYRG